MKRIIALLLSAMLLCAGTGVAEEIFEEELFLDEEMPSAEMIDEGEAATAAQAWEESGIQRGTRIVVGSTTMLSGYFSTDLWGNNTADTDVRALLHGYSTVSWGGAHGMALDGTVVRELATQVNGDGSRTYTISLSDALRYNSGDPITAKDYAFSVLLTGSAAIAELGGMPQDYSHITGFSSYHAGERREISGLRLLDEYTLSISVRAEYQQYFYPLALLNVTPYPMHVIAPGCDVFDDGQGAYIAASEDAQELSAEALGFIPGEFGAEMLLKTMLDPQTGYVFYPKVTSGPYALESYDAAEHEALFVINEQYIGNYEGQKPHIERLLFRPVANETMVEQLTSGEVDLLNKATSGVAIGEALPLVQGEEIRMGSYLRTGLAFLAFACQTGATQSEAVRKAIAHCIDQPAYVASVVGEFNAMPVYGYYGLGQWMVGQTFEGEDGLEALVVADELEKLQIPYDLEMAWNLLIQDGWTLNAEGGMFDRQAGGVRHRMEEDGELTPLVIRWAKTSNPIADATQSVLRASLDILGIGLQVTEMPFDEMLARYTSRQEREFDMFYLASNFRHVFDPYYEYSTADEHQGLLNTSGLRDEELMELARDMRQTEPTALREYTEKWLSFQRRWVELMPMVPLYSNVYFDFFSNDLQDYNIAAHTSWAYAIVYAWQGE